MVRGICFAVAARQIKVKIVEMYICAIAFVKCVWVFFFCKCFKVSLGSAPPLVGTSAKEERRESRTDCVAACLTVLEMVNFCFFYVKMGASTVPKCLFTTLTTANRTAKYVKNKFSICFRFSWHNFSQSQ